MNNKRWIVILKGILFSLLIIPIVVVLLKQLSSPYIEGEITIQQGMTSCQVADLLAEKKIIKSKGYFRLLLNLKRANKKIKAGTYRLNSKTSTNKVIDILVKGKVFYIKLTVPEGFTSKQIAMLLEENISSSAERFIQIVKEKDLEGYLFPDTYFIEPAMKEEEIIKMMTDQFFKVFTPQMEIRAKELGLGRKKTVILASLIEKEAREREERNLISAIFHNRLRKHWRLESCATVRYVLDEWRRPLIFKDLEIDSPYNTYRYYGLPPGPICNPGLASLKAALYPVDSGLMFFVAEGDGTHKFSKYYKEHLLKKRGKSKKNRRKD